MQAGGHRRRIRQTRGPARPPHRTPETASLHPPPPFYPLGPKALFFTAAKEFAPILSALDGVLAGRSYLGPGGAVGVADVAVGSYLIFMPVHAPQARRVLDGRVGVLDV